MPSTPIQTPTATSNKFRHRPRPPHMDRRLSSRSQQSTIPTPTVTPTQYPIQANRTSLKVDPPRTSSSDDLEVILKTAPTPATALDAAPRNKTTALVIECLGNVAAAPKSDHEIERTFSTAVRTAAPEVLSESLPNYLLQPAPPGFAGTNTGPGAFNNPSMPFSREFKPAEFGGGSMNPFTRSRRSTPLPIGDFGPASQSSIPQHQSSNDLRYDLAPQLEASSALPHNSRKPQAHRGILPDLFHVARAAATRDGLVRPPPTIVNGLQVTEPFSLKPPPFTDADIPLPQPYNSSYPHPLTAYASPGVNPHTIELSGYDVHLERLANSDPEKTIGSILFDAGFRDLKSSVYLLFMLYFEGGNGNGIPESLWSKLESCNSTRLPVGVAGVSPFARLEVATSKSMIAPRFQTATHAPIQRRHPAFLPPAPTAFSNDTEHMQPHQKFTARQDYDATPRPSPDRGYRAHMLQDGPPMHGGDQDGYLPDRRWSPSCPPHTHPSLSFGKWEGHSPHIIDRVSSDGPSPRPSKMDVCYNRTTTGVCHWEDTCQHAHGIDGSHTPQTTDNSTEVMYTPWPSTDTPSDDGHYHPVGSDGHANIVKEPHLNRVSQPAASYTSYSEPHSPSRFEPRRASCLAPQLSAVPEHEVDDLPLLLPYRRQSVLVPSPIGAGRPSGSCLPPLTMLRASTAIYSPEQISAFSTPSIGWSAMEDNVPAPALQPRRPSVMPLNAVDDVNSTPLFSTSTATSSLRSAPSSMSLSTSSSSRFSILTQSSDASPHFTSPGASYRPADATIIVDDDSAVGPSCWQGMEMNREASSTSLDFSTGKSIWN